MNQRVWDPGKQGVLRLPAPLDGAHAVVGARDDELVAGVVKLELASEG